MRGQMALHRSRDEVGEPAPERGAGVGTMISAGVLAGVACGVRGSVSVQGGTLVLDLSVTDTLGLELVQALRHAPNARAVVSLGADGLRGSALPLRAAREARRADGAKGIVASIQVAPETDDDDGRYLRFGDALLDLAAHRLLRAGVEVPLRRREFDLLAVLVKAQGRTVPREVLMRDAWGYAPGVVSRTVDTHVCQLRRKLEPEPLRPRFILTVPRVGYRVRMPAGG